VDEPARSPAETVLASVQADPRAAASAARAILEASDDARERVVARWAAGFAERELGNLVDAEAQLREAISEAAALGDESLAARIVTSLTLVVMNRGFPAEALQMIEGPIATLTGGDRARALMQRGAIRYRLADFDGALDDHLGAIDDLREAGDGLALARLHVNVGSIQSYRRDFEAAEASLVEAIVLAERDEQWLLAGYAHHNLGHLRALRGDVPAALAAFDVAMHRYEDLGAPPDQMATLMADRARTLADVGLHREAVESVDVAYDLVRRGANTAEAADIALLTAQIRLDGDAVVPADEPARWARDTYAEQGRTGWVPLADLLCVRTRSDITDEERTSMVLSLAVELERFGWIEEAQHALTLAAQDLQERGDDDAARVALTGAVRLDAVTLKSRTARWLAMARKRALDGDVDGARTAVDAGLDLLRENRSLLGAVELLSRSIETGAELTRLGVELELRRSNASGVLEVLRRAVAVEHSSVAGDPTDEQVETWLTELRHTVNEVRTTEQDSEQRVMLRRRQAELERWIRDRSRRAPRRQVRPEAMGRSLEARSLPASAADRIVVVESTGDDVVTVNTAQRGSELLRKRPSTSLRQLVDTIDFALHRLNRAATSAASRDVAMTMLDDAGGELDALLVPDDIRASTNHVVITPSDVLHGLAWRVLPSLRSRPLTVSSTLGDPAPARPHHHPLLVAGPDLAHADAEVRGIRPADDAVVLESHESTVERVVAEFARADLVHVACHGTFRSDNPLFSALHLADGDLTIYELERCPSLPRTVILSACNAGQSAVLRGGALLGLANALLQMGVASVIAPLSPVNDERLVPLMRTLHHRLAAGDDAASALAAVSTDDAGRLDPTAATFVCFAR
jgi:CHAT domain-containing protein/tetratricopeptide (TPR) repeat protein